MSNFKIDLLKRVVDLQAEIQKDKEKIQDALNRNKKFAEISNELIEMKKSKDKDEKSEERSVFPNQDLILDKLVDKSFKKFEVLFLELVSKHLYISIDDILAGNLNSKILIICNDYKIKKLILEKFKIIEKLSIKQLDEKEKYEIAKMNVVMDKPDILQNVDIIIFYHLSLIQLWSALKQMNLSIQKHTKVCAIINKKVNSFLTEFRQKVELKLISS